MFQNLQERLNSAFQGLKGNRKLTDINIAEAIKEVRRALVDADVNYKIAKEFTDKVKEKAMGKENVLKAVNPGQLFVKIVQDELTELMGAQSVGINTKGTPAIILIAGLQGSGKTTFSGKLANYLKSKKKMRPMLAACDVYRPAAIQQLMVLGEQVGVPVYSDLENKNPVEIALNAVKEARAKGCDVLIIDTAGRLAVDEEMMAEIARVKEALQPTESLFVVDAMTGQDAVNTALAFNQRINYDGVVLTKLDGDTRGGAALSIRYTVGKPIKFVSNGEKMEALDVFFPDRMAQRILGMGDIVSLVERAQEQFDEAEAKRLEKKIKKNQLDFNDFLAQMAQLRKMGNFKSLLGMIPGMGQMAKQLEQIDDKHIERIEAIVLSMTPYERANPQAMSVSRQQRIARGSGHTLEQVKAFVKQFDDMKNMMHQFSKMQGGPGGGMPPGMPRLPGRR